MQTSLGEVYEWEYLQMLQVLYHQPLFVLLLIARSAHARKEERKRGHTIYDIILKYKNNHPDPSSSSLPLLIPSPFHPFIKPHPHPQKICPSLLKKQPAAPNFRPSPSPSPFLPTTGNGGRYRHVESGDWCNSTIKKGSSVHHHPKHIQIAYKSVSSKVKRREPRSIQKWETHSLKSHPRKTEKR